MPYRSSSQLSKVASSCTPDAAAVCIAGVALQRHDAGGGDVGADGAEGARRAAAGSGAGRGAVVVLGALQAGVQLQPAPPGATYQARQARQGCRQAGRKEGMIRGRREERKNE